MSPSLASAGGSLSRARRYSRRSLRRSPPSCATCWTSYGSASDFDRQAWAEFATAYLGYVFGRDEDKRRLDVVVERVLTNKLKRLRGA
jgi:hypothetical protein